VDDNTADRLPPQDLDAEQAVLGCCLLEKGAMERAAGHVVPEDFYREAHQIIYEVIYDLYQEDEPVDIVTVSSGLRRRGVIEKVGGGEYLTSLISIVPTSKHVDRYVKTLKNCSALREGIKVGAELQALCYSFPKDPSPGIAAAVLRLEELQAMCHPNGMPRPIAETAPEDEKRINKRRARPYDIGTARFGIPDLDRKTGGLEDFGYTCAMALTNVGKTALAIQCAVSTAWAIQSEITDAGNDERNATLAGNKAAAGAAANRVIEARKKVIIIFALEEGQWQWHLRMAGYCGLFNTYDTRNADAWGSMLDKDPQLEIRYAAALKEVASLPLHMSAEMQTVSSIESHCRRIARDNKPVLIVVDYMQQVDKSQEAAHSEEQQYRHMANRFRRLSDKIECPILALSQVTESGTGKAKVTSAAGATALEKSGDMNLYVERERDAQTDEPSEYLKIRCRKAKGAPYFKPFLVYEDPVSRRWSAASDKPGDPPPPQGEKTKRPDKRNE
jgi:replicative DNA helicase